MCATGRPRPNPSPSRNRRERIRLLRARDRIGNRIAWADAERQRAAERVAALAGELAAIDRQMLELERPDGAA